MFYSCYCNEELDSIKCSTSAAASSPSIVSTTTSSSAFSSSFSRLASPKALSLPLLAAPVHARLIGGYCCFHSTSKASIEVVPHNDQHTSWEKKRQTITILYLYKKPYLHVCLSGWPLKKNGQVVKWPSTAQRGLNMGSFAVATLTVFAHNLHNWCLVSNGLLGFYLGLFFISKKARHRVLQIKVHLSYCCINDWGTSSKRQKCLVITDFFLWKSDDFATPRRTRPVVLKKFTSSVTFCDVSSTFSVTVKRVESSSSFSKKI